MDRAVGQNDVGAINRVHLVAIVAQNSLGDFILPPAIGWNKRGLVEKDTVGMIGVSKTDGDGRRGKAQLMLLYAQTFAHAAAELLQRWCITDKGILKDKAGSLTLIICSEEKICRARGWCCQSR